MAYRCNDLNHSQAGGDYDEIFHKNTGSQHQHGNYKKKALGNQQILDYHLFSGQYEQSQSSTFDAFDEFNETARKNREQFTEYRADPARSVASFNKAIDNTHMSFDIQRPLATRDQVKDHYAHEHKSLYSHKRTNDYFNDHQFMPGKYNNTISNPSLNSHARDSRLDFYSMQSDDKKGYEDFF